MCSLHPIPAFSRHVRSVCSRAYSPSRLHIAASLCSPTCRLPLSVFPRFLTVSGTRARPPFGTFGVVHIVTSSAKFAQPCVVPMRLTLLGSPPPESWDWGVVQSGPAIAGGIPAPLLMFGTDGFASEAGQVEAWS